MEIECPNCEKEIEVTFSNVGDYTCDCGCKFYIYSDEDYDCNYWFGVENVIFPENKGN